MNIRDWLAIIVIIFIVLILLDGFRRKWFERKNRIVMKLDKSIPKSTDEEDVDPLTKSELPHGGARTVSRNNPDFADGDAASQEVPVLMESVDLDEEDIEEYPAVIENEGEGDEHIVTPDSVLPPETAEAENEEDEKTWDVADEKDEYDNKEEKLKSRGNQDERIEPTFGDEDLTFSRNEQGELDLAHNALLDNVASENEQEDESLSHAEQVIIINIMAKTEAVIAGDKLLPVLLKQGMRLGEMSIFHRHADSDGKGPVMFSMANMLKPGTFSISEMESFTTPGVTFFLQIPNRLGNMQCFDKMLNTAEAVKNEIDAVMKDEDRSVFTPQTIEHSRQRIRDFELEMLAKK